MSQDILSCIINSRVTNITDVEYNGKRVAIIKVRTKNIQNNRGKSAGFRCIVLVDYFNKYAYMLHYFSHKDKNNISKEEENRLKIFINKYIKLI